MEKVLRYRARTGYIPTDSRQNSFLTLKLIHTTTHGAHDSSQTIIVYPCFKRN
jgi:hypothetical protein